MLTCCEVFMRRQLIVSMACAFSFVLSSMASTMPTLPEFRSQQQLAQWRETAAKAAPQSVAAKSTGPAFFTGKPYDAASGNYVFKYRNYNPCLARWTSTDPSGFPDGANNQLIVNNRISSALDNDGLRTWSEDFDLEGSICLLTSYLPTGSSSSMMSPIRLV